MHFNIYVDNQLGQKLTHFAAERGVTRNSLIRDALDRFVQSEAQGWSKEILEFQGIADFPTFESTRSELLAMREDPFDEISS